MVGGKKGKRMYVGEEGLIREGGTGDIRML